jgi:hypothetical protein
MYPIPSANSSRVYPNNVPVTVPLADVSNSLYLQFQGISNTFYHRFQMYPIPSANSSRVYPVPSTTASRCIQYPLPTVPGCIQYQVPPVPDVSNTLCQQFQGVSNTFYHRFQRYTIPSAYSSRVYPILFSDGSRVYTRPSDQFQEVLEKLRKFFQWWELLPIYCHRADISGKFATRLLFLTSCYWTDGILITNWTVAKGHLLAVLLVIF